MLEQDGRRGGGGGSDVLGAGSTSVVCTQGVFGVLEPDGRGGGGWERVLEEEEEAGWGSRCSGAGYWHGYAGVAGLGEDTHAWEHQTKPPTTSEGGTAPSDLPTLASAQPVSPPALLCHCPQT